MEILGIDIGGSGIKGALVDVDKGVLTTDRHRIPTPEKSTPQAVGKIVNEIAEHFSWKGPIGCTLPSVVKSGLVYSAANIDDAWVGVDGEKILRKATGCPVLLLNDADAAGIAEMKFGAGKGRKGVVFMLTFGTGIGSAIFIDGLLVPNTELGHIEFKGGDAEWYAAARVRKEKKLSWKKWGGRVNRFLKYIEKLFTPDLIIFGGGVSRSHGKFFQFLDIRAEIVSAELRNNAGIVGAAMAARDLK
jgi:polyphosphate glucokinase